MSWLRDRYGEVRIVWLFVGIGVASLVLVGIGTTIRSCADCVDTVPAYDGRCWGERDLIVEQGAVVCRCRRTP